MNIKNYNKNRNPFSVPEGYFEEFHDMLMQRIAQEQQHVRPTRIRKNFFHTIGQWNYAAAILCLFLIGGVVYMSNTPSDTSIATVDEYSNEYIDELLDNYPIDDYTFYSYLTSNDTGF